MRKRGKRERKKGAGVISRSKNLKARILHTIKSSCSKYSTARKKGNAQVKNGPKCYSDQERGFLNLAFLQKYKLQSPGAPMH